MLRIHQKRTRKSHIPEYFIQDILQIEHFLNIAIVTNIQNGDRRFFHAITILVKSVEFVEKECVLIISNHGVDFQNFDLILLMDEHFVNLAIVKHQPMEQKPYMPYVSRKQQRLFHAKLKRGEISAATVKEYDQATNFKSLPERKSSPTRAARKPRKG